ncbi:hypothetical protein D3C72_2540990 [compost metagenome]
MHSTSLEPRRIAIATKRPLLTTLWWVSVAPLGLPVVPLVNWILMASCGLSVAATASRRTISGSASSSS